MTPGPLEILGRDSLTYAVSFRRGDNETTATTVELATARKRAARYGCAYIGRMAVDESDLDLLIKADQRDDLALYPADWCGCGVAAVAVVDGEPLCHGHLAGYGAREARA